jgi:hypothetical protein
MPSFAPKPKASLKNYDSSQLKTLDTVIASAEETFSKNVEAVHKLMEFDDALIQFCILRFSDLALRLEKSGIANNLTLGTNRMLDQLKTIRQNQSLRSQYIEIFNQSLVLLVSYFGSSIRDLFKVTFIFALDSGKLGRLGEQDIKISLADLHIAGDDLSGKLADVFIIQKDISFQDMQSIGRAFNQYLGFKPQRDSHVNNIIRHAIVHNGSKSDAKLLKQIADAKPRDLKQTFSLDKKIQFEPSEIKLIGESMKHHMRALGVGLRKQWSNA